MESESDFNSELTNLPIETLEDTASVYREFKESNKNNLMSCIGSLITNASF